MEGSLLEEKRKPGRARSVMAAKEALVFPSAGCRVTDQLPVIVVFD